MGAFSRPFPKARGLSRLISDAHVGTLAKGKPGARPDVTGMQTRVARRGSCWPRSPAGTSEIRRTLIGRELPGETA